MTRIIKVALAQMQSALGDPEKSCAHAIEMLDEAAANGADLVVFPELASTGYHLPTIGPDITTLAETLDGPSVTAMCEAAARNNVYVVYGMPLLYEQAGVPYNSAVFINRDGSLQGTYDKVHLWALERFYFRSGGGYPVFETEFGRIGMVICYDIGFPEAVRSLVLQGCDLVLCPSAWCVEDDDIWETNVPCRALENSVFLAAVNRYGQEGDDLYMHGSSMICNPRGHKIVQADRDCEAIIYAEIDLDDVNKWRVKSPYLRDRRPDTYDIVTSWY